MKIKNKIEELRKEYEEKISFNLWLVGNGFKEVTITLYKDRDGDYYDRDEIRQMYYYDTDEN